MRTTSFATCLCLLFLTASSDARLRASGSLVSQEVTAAGLREHVKSLANDKLRGRAVGTPGLKQAADYAAGVMSRAGLEPGGDDGSFLQKIPLARLVHAKVPELIVTTVDGEVLDVVYGRDFDYFARGHAASTVELELLHVSSLEELPESAETGRAILLDGSRKERGEWLEARGMGEGGGWGLYLRTGSKRPGKARTELPEGSLRVMTEEASGEQTDDPCDFVRVRGDLFQAISDGRVAKLELRVFAADELVHDQNVVGVLRGVGTPERPELANEAVVLTAHIDHIGTVSSGAEGEDLIFNGADDDASGCAAVLAIAEALKGQAAPARTIVFALVTGEEIGGIGARWYLDHPTVPLEATICDLNFEMLGRPDELVGGAGQLWLTGYEKTNLGPLFNAEGLTIVADQRLDQNFYQRSDNYSFVRRGIIGQTLSSFGMHKDYHQVSDEPDTLDYEHMAIAVRSCLEAVVLLSSGAVTPEWTETDEED